MGAGASHAQASSQHGGQHGGAQASAYDAGSYGGGYGQAGAYKDSGYGQVGAAKYNNGPAAAAAAGPGPGASAPGHAAAPQQQALPQASQTLTPACMRTSLPVHIERSWRGVSVGAAYQGSAACRVAQQAAVRQCCGRAALIGRQLLAGAAMASTSYLCRCAHCRCVRQSTGNSSTCARAGAVRRHGRPAGRHAGLPRHVSPAAGVPLHGALQPQRAVPWRHAPWLCCIPAGVPLAMPALWQPANLTHLVFVDVQSMANKNRGIRHMPCSLSASPLLSGCLRRRRSEHRQQQVMSNDMHACMPSLPGGRHGGQQGAIGRLPCMQGPGFHIHTHTYTHSHTHTHTHTDTDSLLPQQAGAYGAVPSGAGAGFPAAGGYGGHAGVPAGGPAAPQAGKYQGYMAHQTPGAPRPPPGRGPPQKRVLGAVWWAQRVPCHTVPACCLGRYDYGLRVQPGSSTPVGERCWLLRICVTCWRLVANLRRGSAGATQDSGGVTAEAFFRTMGLHCLASIASST